jgi:hypothetical protein
MWSIAEYVDHVREILFGMRFLMDTALSDPGTDLGDSPEPRFDPEPRVIAIDTALTGLADEAKQLSDALAAVQPDGWASSVIVGGEAVTGSPATACTTRRITSATSNDSALFLRSAKQPDEDEVQCDDEDAHGDDQRLAQEHLRAAQRQRQIEFRQRGQSHRMTGRGAPLHPAEHHQAADQQHSQNGPGHHDAPPVTLRPQVSIGGSRKASRHHQTPSAGRMQ